MAKERLFNLPETKGQFQVKGKIVGTKKDGFMKDITTKSGKDMKIANYGVEYAPNKVVYETVMGMEQDKVYFNKKAEEKGGKSTTKDVSWGNRFTFNEEGFRLIGNNVGITKKLDDKGKMVNDKKTLTDYDTCVAFEKDLQDDLSVFTKGNIEFSSFVDDKGNKRASVKFKPNQVSLCADIDFASDDYEQINDFNQVIVFTGIEQEKENDKATGRFVVNAKIVTYATIEDAEFIIEDSKLAQMFKKNLKPYTSIKVHGHIVVSEQIEEVLDDDCWGEEDSMNKVGAPTKRELIIVGATPSTIDKETYSESKIDEAIAAINKANRAESDFGSDDNSGWGDTSSLDDDDDDAWD